MEADRPSSLQFFCNGSVNAVESSGNEQVAEDVTKFMTINDIDLTELKSLKEVIILKIRFYVT